jgi:Asp-tRNA(Asn)/Glu-tRNA(Gln) amidotransferase A subunit family amidase
VSGGLEWLGATEAVDLLSRRKISSEELVGACLERISKLEPGLRAWAWLEPERALAAARAMDAGPPRPPLQGLPVGIKDIIDTADFPTESGTAIYRGRRPRRDAACVAALRAAGAVILGKTVTTELAYFAPGPTRNPHDLTRTPGGSSSGSAAAVAACMVPAALGTQTAGSLVRPGAFCGVVGFKPTHAYFSLQGVHPVAPSLDTLGVLVREVADVPLLFAGLGHPVQTSARARPPRVGLWRTVRWSAATAPMQERLEMAARLLATAGATVRDVDLGPEEEGLIEAQMTVMAAEAARELGPLRNSQVAPLSPQLSELLDRGVAVSPEQLQAARRTAGRGLATVTSLWREVDALLTPSAPGEAPIGLGSTGDPIFNRIPTLLGLPCLNLPCGKGPGGAPLGVQLVGAPHGEGPLIGVAGWIAERLEASGLGPTRVE